MGIDLFHPGQRFSYFTLFQLAITASHFVLFSEKRLRRWPLAYVLASFAIAIRISENGKRIRFTFFALPSLLLFVPLPPIICCRRFWNSVIVINSITEEYKT